MAGILPHACPILPEDIAKKKALHQEAEVLVHPVARKTSRRWLDRVLSTEGMCRYVKESDAKEFIIGTEIGILHRLKKEAPGKTFPIRPSNRATCPNMKRPRWKKSLYGPLRKWGSKHRTPDIMQKAQACLRRMTNINHQQCCKAKGAYKMSKIDAQLKR